MSRDCRLWGSSFSPEDIEEARRAGRLLSMEIELSRACNLRCVYCYADAGERLADELTYAEILDAVTQARELGVRRIIVLGGGEPLLYPRCAELIRWLAGQGLGVDLFTNGALLTPELAKELFALGVHPVVKMNSCIPERQDWLAGRAGAFQAIRSGLEYLLAAGYPQPDRPLGVQSVICRQNLEELPGMWVWARERNLTPYFEMLTLQGRARAHPELLVTVAELRALFEELSSIDRVRFDQHWEPRPPIAGLTCNRHLYTCTLTVHGDILPCPGVSLPVGNIRRTRLGDILRDSPVIRDLRDIRTRIKGACRTCPDNPFCYGCRGLAFQVAGDYLAADPLCWKNPEAKA